MICLAARPVAQIGSDRDKDGKSGEREDKRTPPGLRTGKG